MNCVYTWNEMEGSPSSDLYSIMRQVVFSGAIQSVGGLVSILSNHEGQFRPPVMSDVLYDWPSAFDQDASIPLDVPINLDVSGENKHQSLNIFSTGYLGITMIGFYFLSGKTAILFHPRTNLVADACTVIRDVEPNEIAKKLNDLLGADWRWQILVVGPESGNAPHKAPLINGKQSGMGLGLMCYFNSLKDLLHPGAVPPRAMWFPGPPE